MKEKRRKYYIKRPLTLIAIITSILIFVMPIIAMILQRTNNLPDWFNTLSIVSIFLAFIPITILVANFERFMNQQGLINIDKLKKYDELKKPFVLVKRKAITANAVLIISIALLALLWILYGKIGLIICIAITVVLVIIAILSSIFSFIKPKKLLIYHDKKFIVTQNDLTFEIPIEDLRFCRKDYDNTGYVGRFGYLAQFTKYHITLYFKDKTLTFQHADAILAIEKVIDKIMEINGLPLKPEVF